MHQNLNLLVDMYSLIIGMYHIWYEVYFFYWFCIWPYIFNYRIFLLGILKSVSKYDLGENTDI
jgi:hypothetical protein